MMHSFFIADYNLGLSEFYTNYKFYVDVIKKGGEIPLFTFKDHCKTYEILLFGILEVKPLLKK